MKYTKTFIILLFFVSLTSCSKSDKVTVLDLASAMDIQTFVLELPADLRESEVLVLELVGEKGVVNSRNIGESYDEYKYLKIFMDKTDSFNPSFSFVTDKTSTVGHSINVGKAEVRGWTGAHNNTDMNTLQIGEYFVFCSEDGTISLSQNLRGDDLGIRVSVKGR